MTKLTKLLRVATKNSLSLPKVLLCNQKTRKGIVGNKKMEICKPCPVETLSPTKRRSITDTEAVYNEVLKLSGREIM